jgi:hypothetical protein
MKLAHRSFGLATALALAGCGDGNDLGQYLGTWRYDTVMTAALTCGTSQTVVPAAPSEKVFRPGTSAALVDVAVSPFDYITRCDFAYDVSGTSATIQPSQSCAPLLDPEATFAPTSWRFTLLGPDLAEETGGATLTSFVYQDPATGTFHIGDCVYTLAVIKLTRVAAN